MAATAAAKRPLYPGQFVWRLDGARPIKRPQINPPLPESEVKARYKARLNDKSTAEEREAEYNMYVSFSSRKVAFNILEYANLVG
jgi:hypothetical protein